MARFDQRGVFTIREDDFNSVESWLRAAEISGRNVRYGMNVLTMLMARTNQGIAMGMSAGPLDPRMQNPGAAWKMPVRRISSRYYKGWKVKRLAPGVWILYNDTREAYFIEYGINHVGGGGGGYEVSGKQRNYTKGSQRVRRPVRKLSLIKTLEAVRRTNAGYRVWEMIWSPFHPNRRRSSSMTADGFRLNLPGVVSDGVQGVSGMRFL